MSTEKGTRQKDIEKWLSRLAASTGRTNLRALEVGRLRSKTETVGHSTLHIMAHPAVGELVSIDKNGATEAVSREMLGTLAENVTFINDDSAKALEYLRVQYAGPFDFIYLDGASDADICHADLLGALPLTRKGTIIILDDVDRRFDVKGNINVPWCKEHPDIVRIVENVPADATSQGQLVLEVLPVQLPSDVQRAKTLADVEPLLKGMKSMLHIGEQLRAGWEFWPEWFRARGIEHIDVIEVYPPHVKNIRMVGGWRHVYMADVRKPDCDILDPVDVVFWWHGPEHVLHEEFDPAIRTILRTWKPKLIIVGCPWGRHGNKSFVFENKAAYHVSTWYPHEFNQMGWRTVTDGPKDVPSGHITAWKVFDAR